MPKTFLAPLAAAAFGSALVLGAATTASAELARGAQPATALQSEEPQASFAQFRRGQRVYSTRRGYDDGPRYYSRGRSGAGVAAGVIGGLAAGAIIGGAIASQQAQAAPVYVAPNSDAVAYWAQRFRSYDPQSSTYLGYDGLRRACP